MAYRIGTSREVKFTLKYAFETCYVCREISMLCHAYESAAMVLWHSVEV